MILIKKIVLLSFLFALPILVQAQVEFSASSNARQVVLGNSFEITFTLKNGQASGFNPPNFKGFRVLSGPNQSTSMTIINGRRSQEVGYSYRLQPEKIGKFTIPPATIAINKKTIKSNPVTVEVVKGKKGASTQAQIDAEIDEQVFVKIIANTTEARIGQQVVLDYKIFTTLDIRQYNLLTESDYDGFYAHEMRQYPNGLVQEVINGVQYTTKILRRIALFPQQAGLLEIEAADIQVGIATEDPNNPRRRSFFYRPPVKRHNLKTNNVKVNVQPLPPNAPPTFTGAVGKYKMTCDIERVNITTDDAAIINMFVEGNGDVKQVQAAPLILDDVLEVYDPRIVNESTYESNAILYSKKEMEYLVLPKKPGNYEITPAFTYFDTDSLKYITLQPRTFKINVHQGSNKGTTTILPSQKENTFDQDIRFIKTETSLKKKTAPFWGTPLYFALWGLPIFLFGGFFVYHRKQANAEEIDPTVLKRNKAQLLAQKRLSTADQHLKSNNSKAFYDEVSKAMLGYVCDKLNIPTSELTKNNVRAQLTALQVKNQDIEKFMSIIKNCEIALFAGMDNSAAMQTTYDNTIDVVASIEEEIG